MAKDIKERDRRREVKQKDINESNSHRKIIDPERGPSGKK